MIKFLKNIFIDERLYAFFSIVLFSILLNGCQTETKRNESLGRPVVLTTFTILADMARNVAGDRIIINSITKVGAEIHGYQPTPSDIVKASKADLIIENGMGLELWAKKFISASGDIPSVVLSKGMKPLLIEGDSYSGKPNPHVWMSPKRAMIYVDKIVDAFVEIDPLGKDIFEKNASSYKKKLRDLDKELRSSLKLIPKEKRILVTCEGAFTYLANDYGMEEAYLWPVNAESQVTPRRMLRLISKIKETKVPAIFCESTVSEKAQKEVAKSSGARFGGKFYVDSLSSSKGPASTLLELHRHNLKLIKAGLTEK